MTNASIAPAGADIQAGHTPDLLGIFNEAEPNELRDHVAMIHKLADGRRGRIVAASFGQDPDTGTQLPARVEHLDIGDVDGIEEAIRGLATETHRNVYMSLAIMRPDLAPGAKGRIADVAAVLGLVGDFDDANAADYANRLPLPPDYVLETSPGRFQAFYLFSEPQEPARAIDLAARLKAFARCDHGTADITHVWRMPGTLNWPNAKKVREGRAKTPRPVRIAQPWRGSRTDATALDAALPPLPQPLVVETTANDAPIVLEELPQDLQRLIVDGAAPGADRSRKFDYVIKSLKECDHSAAAIHSLLSEHPNGIAEKYAGRLLQEVERAWRKAKGRVSAQDEFGPVVDAPNAEQSKPRFSLRMFADIEPDLNRQWLVEDVLPLGGLALIYAKPGAAKTFTAIDIAMANARGAPWHGRETERGAVLYVSAEGRLDVRIAAYRKHHRLDSQPLPFAAIEDTVNLRDARTDTDGILAAAGELGERSGLPVRLVVIDTLAQVLGSGNENDAHDMGVLIRRLGELRHKLGATVLVLHHLGKEASKGARGHSSLMAAVDTAFEIEKEVLKVTKQRDGEIGAKFGFKLQSVPIGTDAHGRTVTSAIVRQINLAASREFSPEPLKKGKAPARALQMLREEIEANGQSAPSVLGLPPEIRVIRMEQWRAAAEQKHLSKGKGDAQRIAFRRAVDELAGHFESHGDFVWIKQDVTG